MKANLFYYRPRYLLWSVVILISSWLTYSIGIEAFVTCVVLWTIIWFIYGTVKPYKVTSPSKSDDANEAFYISFTNMLSQSEQYDLLWLLNAITMPEKNLDDRYYYDGVQKEFFHTSKSPNNPNVKFIDKFDKEFPIHIGADIAVRLELLNDDSTEIVEIPRLSISEKVGIQLEFLSHLPNTYWHNELISAVEQQEDTYKFVLDDILIENDNSAPMASYWDDFKLKVTFIYLDKFIKAVGLDWGLLNRNQGYDI